MKAVTLPMIPALFKVHVLISPEQKLLYLNLQFLLTFRRVLMGQMCFIPLIMGSHGTFWQQMPITVKIGILMPVLYHWIIRDGISPIQAGLLPETCFPRHSPPMNQ